MYISNLRLLRILLTCLHVAQVKTLLCFHCTDRFCLMPTKTFCGSEDQKLLEDVYPTVNHSKTNESQYDCIKIMYTKYNPATSIETDLIKILGCSVRGTNNFCDPAEELVQGVTLYYCRTCNHTNYCNAAVHMTANTFTILFLNLILFCLFYILMRKFNS